MLTITSVNPTGFFSFGVSKTIELNNQGLILLNGRNLDKDTSNGAGKTSLFNTIVTILFDENPLGENHDSIVNRNLCRQFGKVGFLDNCNVKWRAISTRKWKKSDKYPDAEFDELSEIAESGQRYSGTDFYLERWDQEKSKWIDERATCDIDSRRLDSKSTKKKLINVLGLNYRQFMSIAYLAQQQNLKFANGTHKDRMEVISDLCDIGIWDARKNRVKDRIKETECDLLSLRSTLDGINLASSLMPSSDMNLNEKKELELELVSLSERIKEYNDKLSKLELDNNNNKNSLLKIGAEISDIKKTERVLLLELKDNEAKLACTSRKYVEDCGNIQHTKKDNSILNLENDILLNSSYLQIKKQDAAQLLSNAGRCGKCKSVVTEDHLKRQKELLLLEISELDSKMLKSKCDLNDAITVHEQNIKTLLANREATYNIERNEIECIIKLISDELAKISANIDALNNKKDMLAKNNTNDEYCMISKNRIECLSNISNINSKIKSIDELNKKIEEYKLIIKDVSDKIREDEICLDHLKIVEKLFGDKGIKSYKILNVIAQLNDNIQQFLDILTDGSIKVSISAFKEKKDGDVTTDLQILVRDGIKTDVPFNLYSGGEKQQIILAMIGAFWKVASSQGVGINLLCLDEVFSNLDSVNRESACKLIDFMKSSGRSTIIVVTHDQEIKDYMNFDRNWIAQKENDMTNIISLM